MTEIKERVVYVLTRKNKAADNNTDVYVGSTSYSLKKRLCEHRSTARGAGNENNKLYERMREVGVDSWKITPLLSQLCDKKTIRELEREKCSELNADLNTLSPIRTPDKKRQYDAAYSAAYYEKNKQKKKILLRGLRYLFWLQQGSTKTSENLEALLEVYLLCRLKNIKTNKNVWLQKQYRE